MTNYFRRILSKKALKFLSALALGTITVISIVLLSNGGVRICWIENAKQVCQNFTQNEYQNIKLSLIEKVERNEPLTIQEYQLLIRIYNFEVKNKGKLSLSGIGSLDEILKVLNTTIKPIK